MVPIKYRALHAEEICRELFKDFIRHQVVTKCWRKENGSWIIKDAPFIDDWTEKDYQILISCVKNTIQSNGFVYACLLYTSGYHVPGGVGESDREAAAGSWE